MTTPPNDHTLNACLARRIGVEVRDRLQDFILPKWVSVKTGEYWDPLQNASQLEEVEAEISKEHKIEYVWTGEYWYVTLDRWCLVSHKDKKRALALAIWEMEQSQKEAT